MPPEEKESRLSPLRAIVKAITRLIATLREWRKLASEEHQEVMTALARIEGIVLGSDEQAKEAWILRFRDLRLRIGPSIRPWLIKGLLWALSLLGVKHLYGGQ